MLRVLQVPFTFAPDSIGGTEIYVASLSQQLRAFGVDSIIAAPSSAGVDETYEWDGLRVHRYRYATSSPKMLRELYGEGDPEAARAFAGVLDEVQPDLVHLHALSRAVSVLLVRVAKERRLPIIFTYHTPVVSCQRGTLMLQGKEVCDGRLTVRRCTDCAISGSGLPRWVSIPVSCIPPTAAKILERGEFSGGIWTALRMTALMAERSRTFNELMSDVDGIVALREWIRELLICNGVDASKIVLSAHGLADSQQATGPRISIDSKPLRVAFFGRADKVKGIDTLIKAVRQMRNREIELDLYGIAQNGSDPAYQAMLRKLAGQDSRIRFLAPVPHDRVVSILKDYHLLAVPSRWMETGPLVVLEAFAAGTPIIGSNLGGIAEWVHDGRNGLLVAFNDVAAWSSALERCADDRRLLANFREGIAPPRNMAAVAQEMAELYRSRLKDYPFKVAALK